MLLSPYDEFHVVKPALRACDKKGVVTLLPDCCCSTAAARGVINPEGVV